MVDVERWLSYKGTCHVILQLCWCGKSCLSYKGTCHVILLAKLHDMYLYKTDNFFHINHYLKSVSKVALLHRFYCNYFYAHTGKSLSNIFPLRVAPVFEEMSSPYGNETKKFLLVDSWCLFIANNIIFLRMLRMVRTCVMCIMSVHVCFSLGGVSILFRILFGNFIPHPMWPWYDFITYTITHIVV